MSQEIAGLNEAKRKMESEKQDLSKTISTYEAENQSLKKLIEKQGQQDVQAYKSDRTPQSSSNGFTIQDQNQKSSLA